MAEIAQQTIRLLHWDLEFWPKPASAKLSSQKRSLTESDFGSLLGRAVSLIRIRSRSRASLDSQPQTSTGFSVGSGGAEQPALQEQTQILQTRIELASKYCQRRPYKLKRLHKLRDRVMSGSSSSSHEGHGLGGKTHGFNAEQTPLHRTASKANSALLPTPSIFRLCRKDLADPHLPQKQVIHLASPSHLKSFCSFCLRGARC